MIRRSDSQKACDVFLSASTLDSELARSVQIGIERVGWRVFSTAGIASDRRWDDEIRDALAEAWALVAVVSAKSVGSPFITFEVGAAFAWSKPVFIVTDGVRPDRLPGYLHVRRRFSPNEISLLVEAIRGVEKPLTAEEQGGLMSVFRKARIPADRLMSDPAVLDELTREFNALQGSNRSGEVLLQQLLRWRKAGTWPKPSHPSARGTKKAS
jgi:hypothetical protein